jgi:hypothetical protein
MTTAYLNRVATAVPEHDVHQSFVIFAEQMLDDPRLRTVFRRMVSRADIAHRYSFLDSHYMTRASFIGEATLPTPRGVWSCLSRVRRY